MRILALVTDAFGGRGGIAKFNRDLLTALCGSPHVNQVVAVPRLVPDPVGSLPNTLDYVTSGTRSKMQFMWTATKLALGSSRSGSKKPSAPLGARVGSSELNSPRPSGFDLLICGHINLLPLAVMIARLCRMPLVLIIHGIEAWQPTRSWLVNRLVRRVDVLVAVSEFTRKRFLGWSKFDKAKSFILPNCVDLTQFSPGSKNPTLLDRYDLRDRTVLLTVARISADERYKGIDEVLEVLPELAKQIPRLTYMIVGDGTDRTRLMQKATSFGFQVADCTSDHSLPPANQRHSPSRIGPRPNADSHPSTRVIFTGRIPEREKADHYRLADVFVMPGRGEGFGIVYLEALACGVPVVASQADASCEITYTSGYGIAVDPKNSREIFAAILAALHKFAIDAPKLNNYSRENFYCNVHRLLDDLILTSSHLPLSGINHLQLSNNTTRVR